MLSYETYCLALTIFIVFLIIFLSYYVSFQESMLYLSMQNDIHLYKTDGQ